MENCMFNFIIDFLYKIGFYKNELLDYVKRDEKTYSMFLSDVQLLEKGTLPEMITNPLTVQNFKNFEKTIDAAVKALERS